MISHKVSKLALLIALSTGAGLTYAQSDGYDDSIVNDEFLSEEAETNYRTDRSAEGSNADTERSDSYSESRPTGSEQEMSNRSSDDYNAGSAESGSLSTGDPRIVHFEFDSADVTDQAQQNLREVIDQVQNEPQPVALEISGYTDAIGPEEYNTDLAERRAEAVKEYLSQQNVEVKNWELQAPGEAQPIASNDNPQGRQENRRVEIQVVNAPD